MSHTNTTDLLSGKKAKFAEHVEIRYEWTIYIDIERECASIRSLTSRNTNASFLCFMLRLVSFDPSHLGGQ